MFKLNVLFSPFVFVICVVSLDNNLAISEFLKFSTCYKTSAGLGYQPLYWKGAWSPPLPSLLKKETIE